MTASPESSPSFAELGLNKALLDALKKIGYETPSPIQVQTIPHLLEGKDVLGQAQTGTGKTAAFALPLLSRVDIKQVNPQVLVLTPTRELAIQVAESFQRYAAHIKGFHVAPIYGGQSYDTQIRQLKRGVHVVVGTPGRVMDHMRKGTLKLDNLSAMVLDEADEMLRMGFIDDVEWVLEQIPEQSQLALFSATMPPAIRKIAQRHLNSPQEITIKVKTTTAETIRQRFWLMRDSYKLDALTRLLEVEPFDGMIVFVRTKTSAVELAEKLEARGYAASALTGDMVQKQRERTVNQLKQGKLDILVATDVVARGLDVERITHVINYDVPYDTESYTHRIGRTGRAGREGDAILFISPREKRMLNSIERATRKKIEPFESPSNEIINNKRIERFNQRISDTIAQEDLSVFTQLLEEYQQEHNIPAIDIAAALAKLVQGDQPLLFVEEEPNLPAKRERHKDRDSSGKPSKRERDSRRKQLGPVEDGMERFRLEVGRQDNVRPGNIVGAIANETGIDSEFIGQIEIYDDHTLVDLPEGMPREVFNILSNAWVSGKKLRLSKQGQEKKKAQKSNSPKRKPKKNKANTAKKTKAKPQKK